MELFIYRGLGTLEHC